MRVYSLRFEAVEMDLWTARHAFSFHHQVCKAFSSNWFNFLIVLYFWAKLGKYYSKSLGNQCSYEKERAVIALEFYQIKGKLQLLQTSVNMLYVHFDRFQRYVQIVRKSQDKMHHQAIY